METPVSSVGIANRFVDIANEADRPLTLMKLLKLAYFAHGWYLGITGKSLIDEQVEAWKFGPVAPNIYHAFKENGAGPIQSHAVIYKLADRATLAIEAVVPTVDREIDVFLKKIWNVYGKLTPYQLSELTHQPQSPWYKVWFEQGGQNRKGTDIPDALIKEFFKAKLSAPKNA